MKRLILLVLFLNCCSFFVPYSIKREVSFVKLDSKISFSECEEIVLKANGYIEEAEIREGIVEIRNTDAKKIIENYKKALSYYKKCTNKLISSYRRTIPHLENIDKFMQE